MQKAALKVSGIIFLLVALLHLARIYWKVGIQANQTAIPMEVSWVGALVTLLLALWMFIASRK